MLIFSALSQRMPLLAHNRDFRWVWIATLFTATEEVMTFTAMPLYVLNLTGSGGMLALMWAVQTLPSMLSGPMASVVADRFNRKRIWLAAALVIIALFALYGFTRSVEQLFVLMALMAVAVTFGRNAFLALMPDIVEESELVSANSLIAMNFNVVLLVAPLVAGALIAASGAAQLFILLALLRVCALFCISRVHYHRAAHHTHAALRAAGWWLVDLRAGLQYARERPELRALLIAALGMNLGGGGLIVLETILIKQVLNAGDSGFGLMLSFAGIGAVTGSLLIRPTTARWTLLRVCSAAIVLTGLTFFPYANILWFPSTLIVATVQTLGWVMANVLMETYIQQNVPRALRGRVLGLLLVARSAMVLLAMAIFGPLVDTLGAVLLLNVSGVIYTIAGVYAWLALRPHIAASLEPLAPTTSTS